MRISQFTIKNFKAVGESPIVVDLSENIVTLVGANNSGKTSVVEALDYFFSGTKTIPKEYFHNYLTDEEHAIIITVEFTALSSEDKNHSAVRPYISNEDSSEENWILKKKYFHADGKGKAIYFAIKDGVETENPSGFTQNSDDLFTNEKMQKVHLPPVKGINDVVDPKKKTALVEVFQMLLSAELRGTPQYESLMRAMDEYARIFDPATKHTRITEIEGLITSKLKRIISAHSLINVEVIDGEKVLPTPILQIVDSTNIPTSPEFQGHGVQRSLIFALLELYAESISSPSKTQGVANLLLIEEPEMYMHPQMEYRIADVLYALAETDLVQIVCTTHSSRFIRMFDKQRSLVRISRQGDGCSLQQITEEIFTVSEERDQLRAVMNFDPGARECFFANRVVLVEGDTELVAIPYAAELLGVFNTADNYEKKRGTTIINCRSRDSIPAFQKVLNHFGIEYVVVHDLEGELPTAGTNNIILNNLGGVESRRLTCINKFETDILGINGKWFPSYTKIGELHQAGSLATIMGGYVNFVYDIQP